MGSMQDRLKAVYDLFRSAAEKAKELTGTRTCRRCHRRFKRMSEEALETWAKQTPEERNEVGLDFNVEQFCSKLCASRTPAKATGTRQERRLAIARESYGKAAGHYPYPVTRRERRKKAREVAKQVFQREREKAQGATA